jgi:hypothetical protein
MTYGSLWYAKNGQWAGAPAAGHAWVPWDPGSSSSPFWARRAHKPAHGMARNGHPAISDPSLNGNLFFFSYHLEHTGICTIKTISVHTLSLIVSTGSFAGSKLSKLEFQPASDDTVVLGGTLPNLPTHVYKTYFF